MKANIIGHQPRHRKVRRYLGIILDDFSDHLRSLGYAAPTVADYLRAAKHFGRWLETRGVQPADITQEIIQGFVHKHLPHCHCPKPASRDPKTTGSALHRLFEWLQVRALIRKRASKTDSREHLLSRFDRYLMEVSGLADKTRQVRRRTALELLVWRFGNRSLRLQEVTARDLMRFVKHRARTLHPTSVKALSTSLRSFLRFLQCEGKCREDLEFSVPTLHSWNRAKLPTVIETGTLKRFLASFDRSTPIGRRDYAMALCMSELGLRVSEVAHLSLDDLDWRQNILRLPWNKQRREHQLPLPERLASALASYLRQGRPPSNHREVFLRHRTPLGSPLRTGGVRWAMRRGYERVGIQATGTHILRRTFATRLHQQGVNLKVVADFLGHKDLGTASVYARVNLKQLRFLALPWPKA